jgi:hypothetical protein
MAPFASLQSAVDNIRTKMPNTPVPERIPCLSSWDHSARPLRHLPPLLRRPCRPRNYPRPQAAGRPEATGSGYPRALVEGPSFHCALVPAQQRAGEGHGSAIWGVGHRDSAVAATISRKNTVTGVARRPATTTNSQETNASISLCTFLGPP